MKKIIKWIAILIIVGALAVKCAIYVSTRASSSSAVRTSVTAKVEHKEPVRYGRIVLTDRYQTIEVGYGRSCCVTAVEDYVKASRLANGNLDLGEIEFTRGKATPKKTINTAGRVLTDSYRATDRSQVGRSLVYCTYPEGQTQVVESDDWVSTAIASSIR